MEPKEALSESVLEHASDATSSFSHTHLSSSNGLGTENGSQSHRNMW